MRGSGFLQNSEPKRDLCDNGLTEVLRRWNDSAETVRRMSNCQTKGDLWVPRVNSIAILAKYVVPLQNKILKAFVLSSGLFSMYFQVYHSLCTSMPDWHWIGQRNVSLWTGKGRGLHFDKSFYQCPNLPVCWR